MIIEESKLDEIVAHLKTARGTAHQEFAFDIFVMLVGMDSTYRWLDPYPLPEIKGSDPLIEAIAATFENPKIEHLTLPNGQTFTAVGQWPDFDQLPFGQYKYQKI